MIDTPSNEKPFLAYTVAFDTPGTSGFRQMARMLAMSMTRTYFGGDFLLVRNLPEPVFLVQREGLAEVFVEAGDDLEEGKSGVQKLVEQSLKWKALASTEVIGEKVKNYSWVLFLDVDCLALRNLDHLLDVDDEDTSILYQVERGRSIQGAAFNGYLDDLELENSAVKDGINSGTLAVRADVFASVMAEWLRIQESEPLRPTNWREQCAWNKLVLSAASYGWKARPFEAHEIQFPLHLDSDWKKYRDAALLHCMGATHLQKIEFIYGMYMQKFFLDPKATLLSNLDM